MRNLHPLLALSLLSVAAPALSLPLNTGYDYTTFNSYPISAQDNYWIEVAASAAPVPELSFVVPNNPGWNPPIVAGGTASRWISGTANRGSYPGTSSINPSYSIFRKCFCLLPGYKNLQIRFQLRSDEAVQVWLNSQLNTLLAPSPANFGGPVYIGGTSNPAHFRVGRNCIYVLVEDTGSIFGFNLHGDVTGLGVMPTAAAGTGMSFRPCACDTPTGGALPGTASALARSAQAGAEDDSEVVAELVKIAEQRRRARSRK